MLSVLQFLVLDLREHLQISCLFYSHYVALQPHTTLQSEYRSFRINCISNKPVVPKPFRAVSQTKVEILSYYP